MIPIPKFWIRNPSDVEAIARGCYFDDEAAEKPIEFIEKFCKQSIGRWAGQPLTLFDWQKDFLHRLFGWTRPDGRRRFQRVYLEIAKKNGKSTLLSALELYLLLADGEGAPEIYINACDKKQASIIFRESSRMVESSPSLKKRLKVVGGGEQEGSKRIVWEEGHGCIIPNSSLVDTKDGFNPSAILWDELHRQPNRNMWNVFLWSMTARDQPLRVAISTAGEDESGIWHEERDYSEKVNSGVVIDIEYLGVVYRALPEDDIDSPESWRKANPSLGETFTEEAFKRDLELAKRTPLELAEFMRLRLNIVTRAAQKFIDPVKWKACEGTVRSIEQLRGVPCYGGADLSSTEDLTAMALLFGDANTGFELHVRAYLPEDDIVELERRDKAPYRAWATQGYLCLTPGPCVDYNFIRRDINAYAKSCNLRALHVDRSYAVQLCTDLKESDGINVDYLRQGYLSLTSPTNELMRLILTKKITHDGNPVTTWCLLNAIATKDAAGNIKLSKDKSRLKIDVAAAIVDAVSAAIAGGASSTSVYQSRGVLFV
jgi:phage terminase large subunit-like protein